MENGDVSSGLKTCVYEGSANILKINQRPIALCSSKFTLKYTNSAFSAIQRYILLKIYIDF